MRPSLLLVGTLVALATGCADESRRKGQVTAPIGQWVGKARVQIGSAWPLPRRTTDSAVDGDGRFVVPRTASVVMAYVDSNESGVLERYLEPASHCLLDRDEWNCRIPRTRLTGHRVVVERIGRSARQTVLDDMTVMAEDYDDSGNFQLEARFCVAGRDECAQASPSSFGPAGHVASGLSPCQLKNVVKSGEPVSIRLEHAGEHREIFVPGPPRMTVKATLSSTNRELVFRGETNLAITHALVWFGDRLARNLEWSSEEEPSRLQFSDRALEVRIPRSILRDCEDCKLLVQIAHLEHHGDEVVLISESRQEVDSDWW